MLSKERLVELLDAMKKVKILIIGDACLDIYWEADMNKSELSRETPHYPLPVYEERMSPGGGSNSSANVAALGVDTARMITITGDDWRGHALCKTMELFGITTDCVRVEKDRFTNAYIKPMRHGISDVVYEDPRIDFEAKYPMTEKSEEWILGKIAKQINKVDAVIVVDQMNNGVITDKIRSAICELGKNHNITIDSRDRINKYTNCIVKPNEVEAMAALGLDKVLDTKNEAEIKDTVEKLHKMTNAPVLLTLGTQGSVFYDGEKQTRAEAFPAEPPVDIVGAGDCYCSAFTTSVAAGATKKEAMEIAGIASSIIVKKIGTTGTASPAEMLARYDEIKSSKE